jgi:restriction endonuclease
VQFDLLVKALLAIEPKTNFQKFQAASGIASESVSKNVIDFLVSNGIGTVGKNMITFTGTDRLYTAMLALQLGCDIELASRHLFWKDFEKLASEVLTSLGYQTRTNVRLTKPRMEIDVVGTSAGFAIAVDCKHWNRSNRSSVAAFSEKQAARAERLLKHDARISQVVPVIMTLQAETVRFVGGIPIVPVHKFKSFVIEVKGFLPEIYVAC